MKKLIIAACAVCFFGAAASADPLDDIVGLASLDVDTVTVLDSERWAIMGTISHTDIDYMGVEASSTNWGGSAAWKLGDRVQLGLGFVTSVEEPFDSYAVKGTLRYGFGGYDVGSIK